MNKVGFMVFDRFLRLFAIGVCLPFFLSPVSLFARARTVTIRSRDITSIPSSPLKDAILSGNMVLFNKAIADGADVNDVWEWKCGADNAQQSVETYFPKFPTGEEVSYVQDTRCTPLMYACRLGKPKMVQALLAKGAKPNAGFIDEENGDHFYPLEDLCFAAGIDRTNLIDSLLPGLPQADAGTPPPTGRITRQQLLECFDLLAQAGARWMPPNGKGETALWAAAQSGEVHIVEHCLKQGIDINATDNNGNSVLTILEKGIVNCPLDFSQVIHYLKSKGAVNPLANPPKNNSKRGLIDFDNL